jgi:hypothetical protein
LGYQRITIIERKILCSCQLSSQFQSSYPDSSAFGSMSASSKWLASAASCEPSQTLRTLYSCAKCITSLFNMSFSLYVFLPIVCRFLSSITCLLILAISYLCEIGFPVFSTVLLSICARTGMFKLQTLFQASCRVSSFDFASFCTTFSIYLGVY